MLNIGREYYGKEDQEKCASYELRQFTLDSTYTHSARGKGKVDLVFKELQKVEFPLLEDPIGRGRTHFQDPIYQGIHGALFLRPHPIFWIHSHSSLPLGFYTHIPSLCNALTLHGVVSSIAITFQFIPIILSTSMAIPWGNAIGPLQLVANNDLARAS